MMRDTLWTFNIRYTSLKKRSDNMAQTLLDIQYGDVFGNVKCEKVVLYGDSEDDGLFMNQLKLVVAGKEIAPLSCE